MRNFCRPTPRPGGRSKRSFQKSPSNSSLVLLKSCSNIAAAADRCGCLLSRGARIFLNSAATALPHLRLQEPRVGYGTLSVAAVGLVCYASFVATAWVDAAALPSLDLEQQLPPQSFLIGGETVPPLAVAATQAFGALPAAPTATDAGFPSAALPEPVDLEQQLAPQHFLMAHGQADALIEDLWPEPPLPAGSIEQVVEVRKGDTLLALLVDAGVNQQEAHEAVTALKEVFAPHDLMPGQEITLSLAASEDSSTASGLGLVALSLQPSVERDVQLSRALGGGFEAQAIARPLHRRIAQASGVIRSSLFESAQAQQLPLPVMAEVIRAFSYDVDFQRELQPGDSFEILYERLEDENGLLAKTGTVLHAGLVLSGKRLDLYHFSPGEGRADFFNGKGESVRKALLRTPIDGARMSSGFGMRKHPILGYSKMHKGVDFAAPTGTPIYAAGDGEIVRMGPNGAYGKFVQIRHNGEYSTAYAHVSRFAKGLKPGSRVRQGDVIAYVGSTGRSTGPHLHYEVLVHGKQIDPLSVKLPTGEKLAGAELKAFKAHRDEIDRLRESIREEILLVRSGGR